MYISGRILYRQNQILQISQSFKQSSVFFVFWAVSFLYCYISVELEFFFEISPSYSFLVVQSASSARKNDKETTKKSINLVPGSEASRAKLTSRKFEVMIFHVNSSVGRVWPFGRSVGWIDRFRSDAAGTDGR